jgi:hypothetical protein
MTDRPLCVFRHPSRRACSRLLRIEAVTDSMLGHNSSLAQPREILAEARASAFGQPICSVSDSSNALIPFQAICTPIQTRKKEDNCVITVIPVAPRIRAKRSANP